MELISQELTSKIPLKYVLEYRIIPLEDKEESLKINKKCNIEVVHINK